MLTEVARASTCCISRSHRSRVEGSLLELQQQASQLPFLERAALMRYLKRSLSKDEREALLLEDATGLLDEFKSSAVERVTEIK